MGPLLCNELAMPTKDGVGRNERSNFGEGAASDSLATDGESASLRIGQPESSPTKLLLQDSILLSEILDDRILLAADPAGEGGNEDLPRLKDDGHRRILPISLANRQLSVNAETT